MVNGEIAHFEQLHLFLQCFAKAFFFNVLKWVYMKERVKLLDSLPHNSEFLRPGRKSFLKTLWEKGENAGNQNCLLFP